MNNIASERKRMGLTQTDLAQKLGTSRAIIRNLENGKTMMKSKMLEQMADFFECSTDYLLGRCDDRLSHLRMTKLRPSGVSYYETALQDDGGDDDD